MPTCQIRVLLKNDVPNHDGEHRCAFMFEALAVQLSQRAALKDIIFEEEEPSELS